MSSQRTPQSSPNDPRKEKKKALELKLKVHKEALAIMEDRIFATHLEILKLQSEKESRSQRKERRVTTQKNLGGLVGETLGHSSSDSEWSCDEESSNDEQKQLSC